MTIPTRIDMARELVGHAKEHRRVAESFLPSFDLIPITTPGSPFPFHIQVRDPVRSPTGPTSLDFNLEVRHAIDDLRSALEYCAYDAYQRFCVTNETSDPSNDREVNFPVVRREQDCSDFNRILDNEHLGELRTKCIPAVSVMIDAQYFRSPAGPWLVNLQELWNEGKHRNLVYYSEGIPEIEITDMATTGSQGPGYRFLRGLRFASTRETVDGFFNQVVDSVAQLVDRMGSALYP
jgi:hypothetical protein